MIIFNQYVAHDNVIMQFYYEVFIFL